MIVDIYLFTSSFGHAAGIPCTFTFEKYKHLCVEIKHLAGDSKSNSFWKYDPALKKDVVRSVEKDIQIAGGEVYFYIWEKDKSQSTRNISNDYDISSSLVMPNMYSGACVTGKFYKEEWRQNVNGSYYVGKTYVMPGLYRISIKVRKKGTQERYSEIGRASCRERV